MRSSRLWGLVVSACTGLWVIVSSSVAAGQMVRATGYQRTTVYAAPTQPCGRGQSCRWDSWTGAWLMPDASLMLAFTQATGPTRPPERTFMPEDLLHEFGLTEDGTPGYTPFDPGRDFFGLSGGCPASPQLPEMEPCTEIVYLNSIDAGQTWNVWRTDPFQALLPTPYTPQATIALPNGALIRRVNGDDLRDRPSIPYTAMLQVLEPDPNGSYPESWPELGKKGQVVVTDPYVCKYQISRIRPLNDGTNRLIAMGQAWPYAGGGTSGRCASSSNASHLLLVADSPSAAEQGQWTQAMPFVSPAIVYADEWDAAPLASGDLLALFRTRVGGMNVRRQAILRAAAGDDCPDPAVACWIMDTSTLGNPGGFQHSGHPELLATSEGVIIEFASDRVAYTVDDGASWSTLSGFSGGTSYYPRAVQDVDGDIYVFSHVGGDDPYGGLSTGDYAGIFQSIVMQKFRLVIE